MLSIIKDGLFSPVSSQRKTFYSIDILRGISALAVVIFHFKNFAEAGGALTRPASVYDGIQLLQWLSFFKQHGGFAVMVFWSISGFVFMSSYAGTRPTGWSFFLKRFARLYPLHLFTLIIVAIIQLTAIHVIGHDLVYSETSLSNFFVHLFMASGWGLETGRSFNFPIWTVSVEILVYALFFAFVRYLTPRLLNLLLIWAAFQLAALAMGDARGIFICGAYFFAGAITYTLYSLYGAKARVALLVLTVLVGAAAIGIGLISQRVNIPLTLWVLPLVQVALMLLACLQTESNNAWLRRMHPIGDITYSSYLWHTPLMLIFLLMAGMNYVRVDIAFTDAFLLSYVVAIFLVSTASFRLIEKPAQRWVLRHFNNSK